MTSVPAWASPVADPPAEPAAPAASMPTEPAAPAVPDADRFECLRAAYPSVVDRLDTTVPGGEVVLVDGTRLQWDDGQDKTREERLARPDVQDVFAEPYPIGPASTPPRGGEDPGRVRHPALMAALWGADRKAVGAELVGVEWFVGRGGRTLKVNRRHGAADALRAVAADLAALPAELHRYVIESAGTFNWRRIKGTDRLSAHSHGVAIDTAVKYTHYWRWSLKREPDLPWRNRIPLEIVRVFERHGFVWGGKWHHYDTMHFEYRPELLHPRCVERRG